MQETQEAAYPPQWGDGPFGKKMRLMQKFGEQGWIPQDHIAKRPSKKLYGRIKPYPDNDPYVEMTLDAFVLVMRSGDQGGLEAFMESVKEGFGEKGMARLSPELEFLKGRIEKGNSRKRSSLPSTGAIFQAPR